MRRLIKKRINLFITIIICMLMTIIGTSYAAFRNSQRAGDQVVETDLLSVTYSSGSAMITGDIYAQTNTEGMAQDGYSFTINNQSPKYDLDYKITIFNNPPANFSGNLVDHQYIWIGIDNEVVGKLSDLTYTNVDNVRHYQIYSDLLNHGANKTHVVKVWLDDNTPNTEGDKYVYLKLEVEGEASTNLLRNMNKTCIYLNSDYAATPSDHTSIGTAYSCDPGDGTYRTFYILTKDNNNVKLIMDRNITDSVGSSATITWDDAVAFFDNGHDGYATKQAWNKVLSVDLPSVQEIMDASLAVNPKDGFSINFAKQTSSWWCLGSHDRDEPSGPTFCPTSEAQQKVAWLFSYTRDCASRGCYYEYPESGGSYSYGYWTKDLVATNNTRAWIVYRYGRLGYTTVTSTNIGARPVITINLTDLGDTSPALKTCSFIDGTYGSEGNIGAKYSCDPGDGVSRNFYILAKDNGNVKLIMDRNINDTSGSNPKGMPWEDALAYFNSGNPGYIYTQTWTKVSSISLPGAEETANAALAVNPNQNFTFSLNEHHDFFCLGSYQAPDYNQMPVCPVNDNQRKTGWLYDYLYYGTQLGSPHDGTNKDVGYWTKDDASGMGYSDYTWVISYLGYQGPQLRSNQSGQTDFGVRPVIIISESDL